MSQQEVAVVGRKAKGLTIVIFGQVKHLALNFHPCPCGIGNGAVRILLNQLVQLVKCLREMAVLLVQERQSEPSFKIAGNKAEHRLIIKSGKPIAVQSLVGVGTKIKSCHILRFQPQNQIIIILCLLPFLQEQVDARPLEPKVDRVRMILHFVRGLEQRIAQANRPLGTGISCQDNQQACQKGKLASLSKKKFLHGLVLANIVNNPLAHFLCAVVSATLDLNLWRAHILKQTLIDGLTHERTLLLQAEMLQ